MNEKAPEELSFPINWDKLNDDAGDDIGDDVGDDTGDDTGDDLRTEIAAEIPRDPASEPEDEAKDWYERAPEPKAPADPPTLNLVAAAWADLVALLAFVVAELIAVVVAGYDIKLPALPWVVTLALAWWCAAALVLVVVRRGTPGMLMAGVAFRSQVPSSRLAPAVLVALLLVCLLGLPALLGAQRSLLRLATGSPLACLGGI